MWQNLYMSVKHHATLKFNEENQHLAAATRLLFTRQKAFERWRRLIDTASKFAARKRAITCKTNI